MLDTPEKLVVGTRVLARREPDLEPEEGLIKKVRTSASGSTTYNVRLVADGYMVPNTPVEELAVLAADVQAAASRHPSDELRFEADADYDATVGPQLPEAPADPRGEEKYEWAAAYKEAGNALFQQGQHAWALRTYLTGVQQLQLLGYGDPEQMFSDVQAWPVCTASFSNAALCALKLGRHDLAAQCCDRGLRFASSDASRAKLLTRKAQALLDRPTHAQPDAAVELLQRAAQAQGSRAVQELLQRAKREVREKQRAADRALFGGNGLARRGVDASDRADASRECDGWLREGAAQLLGVSPSKEFVEHQYRDMAEITGGTPLVKPQVDLPAARTAFELVQARALEAGLKAARAHASFGLAAAAMGREAWEEAAQGFDGYFTLAENARASGEGFEPPLLGIAYAHYHAGLAEYQLRRAAPAQRGLQAYLDAAAAFVELDIFTSDGFGGKTYTDYDCEVQRQRQWVVSGRCQHSARRMLVSVHEVLASNAKGDAAAEAALRAAVEHAEAALSLSWEEAQRVEAGECLARLLAALGQQEEAEAYGRAARAAQVRLEELEERRAAAAAPPPPPPAETPEELAQRAMDETAPPEAAAEALLAADAVAADAVTG